MNGTVDDTSPRDHLAKVAACPDQAQWLNWLSDRSTDVLQSRPELQHHLDECTVCAAEVADVRRFQTLLMRGRAPGLSPEQRGSLEERVRLQSGLWEAPNRPAPGLVWGLALCAATAIALLVLRPFADPESAAPKTPSVALQAAAQPATAQGDVEVFGVDGVWTHRTGGLALTPGTRLRSADGGQLIAPGRFEVSLAPGSELEVKGMTVGTAALRVRRGEVQCQVDKLLPGQRFALMFGGFRASVVGTRFTVRQDGTGVEGRVQVTEGAVRVDAAEEASSPPGETTLVVRAGHTWRHQGGAMILEPTRPVEPAAPSPAAPAAVVPAPLAPAAAQAVPDEEAARNPVRAKAKAASALAKEPEDAPIRQIVIEVPPQPMPPPEAPVASERQPGTGKR